MSEMVTVRTRKLWTCLPGKPRWIVGRRQTSAETRKLFPRISCRIRQAPSDLRQEFLGTDTHGTKCFQGHWNEIVGPAERAVLCCLYLFIYY